MHEDCKECFYLDNDSCKGLDPCPIEGLDYAIICLNHIDNKACLHSEFWISESPKGLLITCAKCRDVRKHIVYYEE